jgi:hypothetical protein
MAEIVSIPTLQIRPNYLLIYTILEGLPRRGAPAWRPSITEWQRKKAYSGLITPGSAKNMRRAIENMVAASMPKTAVNFSTGKEFKFKVNFITLTLPCKQGTHTDQTVKKTCLDNWLKSARQRFKLRSYVWRAERQLNGNVHFHIVTDCYIHYEALRDSWNARLNHLGYIDEFFKKHGHRTPNSTDVHAVSKIRNLASYMVKYMTKGVNPAEDFIAQPPWCKSRASPKPKKNGPKFQRVLRLEEQKIDGRVWDCSTNLKTKAKCDFIIDGETEAMLDVAINTHQCRYKVNPRCSLVFLDKGKFEKVITGRYREAWEKWLNGLRC